MTVRMDWPVPPEVSATLGRLRLVVSGEKRGERETRLANPLRLARSILDVSDPLGGIASRVFSATMEKSGPVTVRDMSRVWKSEQVPAAMRETL